MKLTITKKCNQVFNSENILQVSMSSTQNNDARKYVSNILSTLNLIIENLNKHKMNTQEDEWGKRWCLFMHLKIVCIGWFFVKQQIF